MVVVDVTPVAHGQLALPSQEKKLPQELSRSVQAESRRRAGAAEGRDVMRRNVVLGDCERLGAGAMVGLSNSLRAVRLPSGSDSLLQVHGSWC